MTNAKALVRAAKDMRSPNPVRIWTSHDKRARACVSFLNYDAEGRCVYRYALILKTDKEWGTVAAGSDLRSGVDSEPDDGKMLYTLAAFVGAWAESKSYHERTGRKGENADLFPESAGPWLSYAEEFSNWGAMHES